LKFQHLEVATQPVVLVKCVWPSFLMSICEYSINVKKKALLLKSVRQ